MTRRRSGMMGMAATAAALALGGCVDMFTSVPPADAVPWHGTTTAGNPAFPECAAFNFQLGQHDRPVFLSPVVSGRAWLAAAPLTQVDKWAEYYSQWWLEGYVTSANFVQFESRRQQPIYFRAKPYAVWRGTIEDDRMTLVESGSPCNRQAVLARG
jgi:hypothetical protein